MAADDQGGLLGEFEQFLEAKRAAAEKASQSEYDNDDFEWYEDDKDGSRRGGRTTVRAARNHGPEWVKGFFAKPAEPGKDGKDGKDGDGAKPPAGVKTLFPARKQAAGQGGG